MGTISVSLPSDGQTIDAADYNVPINTIVAAINGNIDSNNILAGGVVPNSLTSGTGTSWARASWTPTLTNLTLGNGTVTAKYIQIGKLVYCDFVFVLGSTSAVGTNPSFSLPVTSVSPINSNAYLGQARLIYADIVPGAVLHASTTLATFTAYDANSTFPRESTITAASPTAWTTNNALVAHFWFEAA